MSTSLLEDLLKHAPQDSRGKVPEYQEESFKYQLECLKLEIDLVERTLSRIETITQTVKNFAVVSWAGAVTIFLGQNDLRRFVLVTALLPVIFWLLDGWWVHMNRGASVSITTQGL